MGIRDEVLFKHFDFANVQRFGDLNEPCKGWTLPSLHAAQTSKWGTVGTAEGWVRSPSRFLANIGIRNQWSELTIDTRRWLKLGSLVRLARIRKEFGPAEWRGV